MAGVAFDCRVCAQQGEAILVILHLLRGDIPTLDGVTLCAIRTHLPAVNIRVTVGTVLAHVREDRFYVARDAIHLLVHSAQGIFCFTVIKLGYGTNRAPRDRGVAILAGNRERPVGAAPAVELSCSVVARGSRRMPGCHTCGRKGKYGPESVLEERDRIRLRTLYFWAQDRGVLKNSTDCALRTLGQTTVRADS